MKEKKNVSFLVVSLESVFYIDLSLSLECIAKMTTFGRKFDPCGATFMTTIMVSVSRL